MHACMFIHKYVNICLALLLMTFIIITYIYAHVYEAICVCVWTYVCTYISALRCYIYVYSYATALRCYIYVWLASLPAVHSFAYAIFTEITHIIHTHRLSYTHTHRLCVSPSLVPSVPVSMSLSLRRARELSLFLSHALSPSGTQTLGRTLYTSTSMHCAHENTQVYPTSSTAFWRRAWYVCMCVCVCLCGCGFGSGSVPGV